MRKLKVAAIAAAVVAVGVTVGVISLPASAEAATFVVTNSWNNGYQAEVTVSNSTSSTINTWKVQLTLPGGTTVANSWNATQAVSGTTVTFTPASYNGKIAAGSSTSFGFVANGTGRPTSCTVNGQSCGTSSAAVPSSAPTSSRAAVAATKTTSPAATRTTAPTKTATVAPSKTTAAATGSSGTASSGTPLAINGQLHVCGVHLCNQFGKAIQLRGMSTHGIQFAPKCYNTASLDALAGDWGSDLLRIAMYVQEGGYETDPAGFTAKVDSLVDQAEDRGMYAIVDFHILNPGDPSFNLARAKQFFADVSKRNAAKKNVMYEIENEPNGVPWTTIKNYAEQVIPIIRANDPDAVVLVGTRAWSSLGVSEGSSSAEVINNPVNATNIMYSFHFYAASHKDNYRAEVQTAAAKLPLFVTEFGTPDFTGNGAVDLASTTTWLNLLDSLKISYANWTYSDINETSAAFVPGTCNGTNYTSSSVLTTSGAFIRARLRTPDNFPTN